MNFNNFTIKSQEAVQKAVELVQNNGQQVVETPHLFKGILLAGEDVVQFLFGKLGVNMPVLNSVIDSMLSAFPKVTGGEPYLSRETNNVLQKAIDKSSKAGDQFVSLEYILLALVAENAPEPADGVGVQPDPSTDAASSAPSAESPSSPTTPPDSTPSGPFAAAAPAGEAAAKPITHDDARAELNVYAEKNGMEKAKALVQRYVPTGEKPQLSKIPAERLAEFVAECNA